MPRKLVYYVACTLDGFIARTDGTFDCFLFEGPHFQDLFESFPETFPAHLRARLGVAETACRFDTVLMGRRTYEVGLREGVTNPYRPLRQMVISASMTEPPDPEVGLHGGCPVELVRRLKQEPGRDIWLCGGGELAGSLAMEIDEIILKVNPVLIGRGIPLLGGFEGKLPATLLTHRAYPNGFVLARYEVNSGAR
ncbi:MAG: dihydrofolate reductase family protein [Bryobacterales bacterium]|nr:dihydrofolate reductase family protein [Bryobacterales bacterium]